MTPLASLERNTIRLRLRERFEKLEAREMLHQSNHAIVRNGWDEFDVLPVYRSLLMNRNDEAEPRGRSVRVAPA